MKPYGILKYITGGDKWKLTIICMTEIKKNQKKNWWKDTIDYLSRNAIKLRVRK